MKLTKKLLAVLLAAMMLLTAVPFAFAGDMTYTLADGVLTVSGSGAMPDFQYRDHPWKGTENEADVLNATSIVIEGFTTIGSYAFKNFTKATSVTIPAAVTEIGMYAFNGCEALADVTLPAGITEINNGTFNGCKALTGIVLPEKVETIDSYAFSNTGLTEITLPMSVKRVDKYAFSNCTALKKVVVKNNAIELIDGCFPAPYASEGDTVPLTIYSVYNSKADNFAIAKGYGYERIPDENKPDLGTPETVQEVIQKSEQEMKDTKIGGFLRRLFELLGIKKTEKAEKEGTGSGSGSGAEAENGGMKITGPGKDLANFLMRTSFADIILTLREAVQSIFGSAKIEL